MRGRVARAFQSGERFIHHRADRGVLRRQPLGRFAGGALTAPRLGAEHRIAFGEQRRGGIGGGAALLDRARERLGGGVGAGQCLQQIGQLPLRAGHRLGQRAGLGIGAGDFRRHALARRGEALGGAVAHRRQRGALLGDEPLIVRDLIGDMREHRLQRARLGAHRFGRLAEAPRLHFAPAHRQLPDERDQHQRHAERGDQLHQLQRREPGGEGGAQQPQRAAHPSQRRDPGQQRCDHALPRGGRGRFRDHGGRAPDRFRRADRLIEQQRVRRPILGRVIARVQPRSPIHRICLS